MPTRRPGGGFTLLEVVIVMTVLVTLLALAAPAMRRALAKNRLGAAAGELRTVLAKTRLTAIESGVVQTFCYQPGTNKFVVVSHVSPAAERGPESSPEPQTLEEAAAQELAADIVFLDPEDEESLPVADEEPGASGDAERIRVHDAKPIERAPEWSRPVVFFPSGRASSARFRLLGRFDYYVDVELRGLTGTVKLGDVQRPRPKDSLQTEDEPIDEQDRPSDSSDVLPSQPEFSPAAAVSQPSAPPEEPPKEPAGEALP